MPNAGDIRVEARRLYISHIAEYDWLTALEFGRVDDGQPDECWRPVGEQLGYLHGGPAEESPPVGFKVIGFSSFDPEDPDYAEIWGPPLFDAPQLGLPAAPAGQIVLAARSLYGDSPSLNRLYFESATRLEGQEALEAWTACLHAGDSMAHFALGYTLYELGRFRDAYRHLRYYAQISPAHPWNHCWYGKAAEALGEFGEAATAYRRATELTEEGAEETDATELLADLERMRGSGDGPL